MPIVKVLRLAIPVLASLAILATAPADTPAARTCQTDWETPSNLDYLVLASLADASHVVGMAAYTGR